MNWTTERKVIGSLVAALVALAVIRLMAHAAASHQIEADWQVARTQEVLGALASTFSTIQDAETGQRGYLITRADRYLEPYRRAHLHVDDQLKAVRQLTSENPAQQARLDQLEPLVREKFVELDETIRLSRTEGFEAAAKLVETDRGRVAMEAISHLIEQMTSEERNLLRGHSLTAQADAHRRSVLFFGTTGLEVLLSMLAFYLIYRHVAERNRAQEALRRIERRHADEVQANFTAIVDAVMDGIITIDERGTIEFVNRATLVIFGYTKDELVGQNVMLLMPTSYRSSHENGLRKYLQTGEQKVIGTGTEVIGLRKDGTTFPLDISVSEVEVCGPGGRLFTGVLRDITERKTAEADRAAKDAAEAANQAKEECLAVLSHELRTPLGGVLLWAKLLRAGKLGEAQTPQALDTIIECAEAQSKLVHELLDASRLKHGKVWAEMYPVDLGQIVRTVIMAMRPEAEAKDIGLDVFLCDGKVLGDASLLRQVMGNLLCNAIKFTPNAGHIQVRLTRQSTGAQIMVIDSGEGISPALLPHVFERFRQAEGSTVRCHGGLGLGLSIVQDIVLLHGGSVEARSEGVGLGSTFTVTIPRDAGIIPPTNPSLVPVSFA
jgi:PAS domain S-box-containing protein